MLHQRLTHDFHRASKNETIFSFFHVSKVVLQTAASSGAITTYLQIADRELFYFFKPAERKVTKSLQGSLMGPLHIQVRDALRERIVTREWLPGRYIPSETELAMQMSVSVGTMRRAIKALEDESLLERQRGKGTFVTEETNEKSLKRFSNITYAGKAVDLKSNLVNCAKTSATDEEALLLKIKAGDDVYRVTRKCILPNKLYAVEKIVVPAKICPAFEELSDLSGTTLFGVYRNRYNIIVSDAQETVSCLNATSELARDLNVEEGLAVMCIDRVSHAKAVGPVEWSRRFINMENARYNVTMS